MDILSNDVERLNFEDFIWVIFIGLSILNIVGDHYLKEFIKKSDKNNEGKANSIFLFVLIISLFIYIYFFIRNVSIFEKANEDEKKLLALKVFGSSLIISGVILLIYFQSKQTNFVGTPA